MIKSLVLGSWTFEIPSAQKSHVLHLAKLKTYGFDKMH